MALAISHELKYVFYSFLFNAKYLILALHFLFLIHELIDNCFQTSRNMFSNYVFVLNL